jgi:hypothetical protein
MKNNVFNLLIRQKVSSILTNPLLEQLNDSIWFGLSVQAFYFHDLKQEFSPPLVQPVFADSEVAVQA